MTILAPRNMKHRIRQSSLPAKVLLLLCFATSGCLLLPTRIRHSGSGRVIDAKTGNPITGARVLVSSWRKEAPSGLKAELAESYETTTDAAGNFSIPADIKWMFGPPLPDRGKLFRSGLCISKDGYELVELDPWKIKPQHPRSIEIKGTYSLNPSTGPSRFCGSKP